MGSSIQTVDLVLAIVLLIFAFIGWKRGLIRELFSLSFLLAGLLIWGKYEDEILLRLTNYLSWFPWLRVAAFSLLLLTIGFVSMLLNSLLFRFVKTEGRAGLPTFLGGLAGLYRGAVLCVALLWIVNNQPFKDNLLESYSSSFLIPQINKLVPFIGSG